MGEATNRLIDKLGGAVSLARVNVRPHIRTIGGKPTLVKGHKRVLDLLAIADDTPASRVNLQDQRSGGPPLKLNPTGLEAAMAAAGVIVGPKTKIRLRLRDQKEEGEQGSAKKVGDDEYRVVIKVAKKEQFKPHHLYIINNSLVHELRHVRQMQDEPDHSAKYQKQNMTVGYHKNKYEVEARKFGRLADQTGERSWKGLPEGMKILGEAIWGLVPG